jgi:hypothetical protein
MEPFLKLFKFTLKKKIKIKKKKKKKRKRKKKKKEKKKKSKIFTESIKSSKAHMHGKQDTTHVNNGMNQNIKHVHWLADRNGGREQIKKTKTLISICIMFN